MENWETSAGAVGVKEQELAYDVGNDSDHCKSMSVGIARAYSRKKIALSTSDETSSSTSATAVLNSNGATMLSTLNAAHPTSTKIASIKIPGAPIVVKRHVPSQQEVPSAANTTQQSKSVNESASCNSLLDAAGGVGWGYGEENRVEYSGACQERLNGGELRFLGAGASVIPGAPIVVKPGSQASSYLTSSNCGVKNNSDRKRERPSTAGSDQAGLYVKAGIGFCPDGASNDLIKPEVFGCSEGEDLILEAATAQETNEDMQEEMEEWELQVRQASKREHAFAFSIQYSVLIVV